MPAEVAHNGAVTLAYDLAVIPLVLGLGRPPQPEGSRDVLLDPYGVQGIPVDPYEVRGKQLHTQGTVQRHPVPPDPCWGKEGA